MVADVFDALTSDRVYRKAWPAAEVFRYSRRTLGDTSMWLSPLCEQEEALGKQLTVTFEQAEEQAWGEIEARLPGLIPYDLQELVAHLLQAMGYHVGWVASLAKDGGVDIMAWTDPLGTRPRRIKVQVKRLGESIRVGEVRSFMALLGDQDVGLFVTTGGFTKDAEAEARDQESRPDHAD
jgi:restriction system protein